MARSIEISTAHNIVVYFNLASLMDRIVAVLLDLIIMYVSALIIGGIISSLGLPVLGGVLGAMIVVFYHLVFEIFNAGQSPGKKILHLKVVNLKGLPPSPGEAFQRWVFRLIDIFATIGALGSLFITSSPKNQRIGDLISGCSVIKLKKSNDVTLERILKIQDRERVILYPGVVNFKEDEMLLVKEILMRYIKFKNRSTRIAVQKISQKLSKSLGLQANKTDHIAFLENVLKDYVSLTR